MKAQLKLHNGTPTVFLDDQPAFFGCHLVGGMDPKNLTENQPHVKKYAEAGVHIYSVDNFSYDWVGPRPDNPLPYDFKDVVPRMQTYIDMDPQALFLMRMSFDTRWPPSDWWNKAYPDEVEVLSDGERNFSSFASTVWRAQVKELLAAFIQH